MSYTSVPWSVSEKQGVVSDQSIDTGESDRDLIASAHEVLKALEELIDTFSLEEIANSSNERIKSLNKAYEALFKARGKW